MITFIHSIIEGYRLLFERLLQALLFLALLAIVSGAIATPVWLLASSAPGLLNWLFLILCGLLCVLFIRGRRRSRPTRPASETAVIVRYLPVIVTLAAAGSIIVGLASRTTPLLATGIAIFSLGIAWFLGR